MLNKNSLSVILLLFFSNLLVGQDNISIERVNQNLTAGLSNFQRENYSTASHYFKQYLSDMPDEEIIGSVEYLKNIALLKAGRRDGKPTLESSLKKDPSDPQANKAYKELAIYFTNQSSYDEAAYYFNKAKNVDPFLEPEFYFLKGVTFFKRKHFSEAEQAFKQISDFSGDQGYAANYYLGYMAYQNENLSEASGFLDIARSNPEYYEESLELQIAIYQKEKAYDKIIMEIGGQRFNSDLLNNALADAYFYSEDYKNSISYYNAIKKRLSHPQYYKLGYSYLKTDDSKQAIEHLKYSVLSEDTIGQYSAYFLGKLYLELGNYPYAITSFSKATAVSYNKDITKQAHYQLGKVHFLNEDYENAINTFNSYIDQYSRDENFNEINELIGESYLKTSNYERAIRYIDQLSYKSDNLKESYQLLAFKKASQLYNDRNFRDAVTYFKKSLKYPVDQELVYAANYWLGEAYFTGKRFDQAIDYYNSARRSSEFNEKATYGLAYSHFNKNQYLKATGYFYSFLGSYNDKNDAIYFDAFLRYADCLYASKQYKKAIEAYQNTMNISSRQQDYVIFQMGLIYALMDQPDQAFDKLEDVQSGSPYWDDAQFYTGKIFFEQSNYDLAINEFSELLLETQNSPYAPRAYLNRGISYFNQQQYDLAENDYKFILNQYPNHTTANSALLGLQELLTTQNRIDELDEYLTQYKKLNPEDSSIAAIEYEAARSLYFNRNYAQAIGSLRSFLAQYPNFSNKAEAFYYLADAYYRDNKPEKAIVYFDSISNPVYRFYNRAVTRKGRILIEQEQFEKALSQFRLLSDKARNTRELADAYGGMLEVFFNLGQYDSSLFYCKQIFDIESVSIETERKSIYFMGRNYMAINDFGNATDEFIKLINGPKDTYHKLARYYLSEIFFFEDKHKQSIESLFEFNKAFPEDEYWLGKSFLLIAKNYIEINEIFQARATLNSIIEKSPVQEITKEAMAMLEKLEQKESEVIKTDTVQK
ncbi:MAG TPA: tetratricopeptide repeat protein [Cyclobacteriaceae bacterium]